MRRAVTTSHSSRPVAVSEAECTGRSVSGVSSSRLSGIFLPSLPPTRSANTRRAPRSSASVDRSASGACTPAVLRSSARTTPCLRNSLAAMLRIACTAESSSAPSSASTSTASGRSCPRTEGATSRSAAPTTVRRARIIGFMPGQSEQPPCRRSTLPDSADLRGTGNPHHDSDVRPPEGRARSGRARSCRSPNPGGPASAAR